MTPMGGSPADQSAGTFGGSPWRRVRRRSATSAALISEVSISMSTGGRDCSTSPNLSCVARRTRDPARALSGPDLDRSPRAAARSRRGREEVRGAAVHRWDRPWMSPHPYSRDGAQAAQRQCSSQHRWDRRSSRGGASSNRTNVAGAVPMAGPGRALHVPIAEEGVNQGGRQARSAAARSSLAWSGATAFSAWRSYSRSPSHRGNTC